MLCGDTKQYQSVIIGLFFFVEGARFTRFLILCRIEYLFHRKQNIYMDNSDSITLSVFLPGFSFQGLTRQTAFRLLALPFLSL